MAGFQKWVRSGAFPGPSGPTLQAEFGDRFHQPGPQVPAFQVMDGIGRNVHIGAHGHDATVTNEHGAILHLPVRGGVYGGMDEGVHRARTVRRPFTGTLSWAWSAPDRNNRKKSR